MNSLIDERHTKTRVEKLRADLIGGVSEMLNIIYTHTYCI